MRPLLQRAPALALPFTIITNSGVVRLVAGEDYRYTFTAAGLDEWLPELLKSFDGKTELASLLAKLANRLSSSEQQRALKLIERLYDERILIDGPVPPPPPGDYRIKVNGKGALAELLAQSESINKNSEMVIELLCQDRLDYAEALSFNRQALRGSRPWIWVTSGPLSRGFVSPIFLPTDGPCLNCLISQFRRLSPSPEIYDELIMHAQSGGEIASTNFPKAALQILSALADWKISILKDGLPPVAAFQLHVLEVETMEVTTHRVFIDQDCPDCQERY